MLDSPVSLNNSICPWSEITDPIMILLLTCGEIDPRDQGGSWVSALIGPLTPISVTQPALTTSPLYRFISGKNQVSNVLGRVFKL